MALTEEEKINRVRLLIGDVESSPFYPLYTDGEVDGFLDMAGGDVCQAAKLAAISAAFQFAGINTREITGDIEVWNSLSTQYLKALDYLITNPSLGIPSGLIPWMHTTSMCNLTSIKLCSEEPDAFSHCRTGTCSSNPCECKRR